jgi:Domain of unknown function (DUF4326)
MTPIRKRTKGWKMPKNTVYGGHVQALRGKHLACWCPIGSPCHADVLLKLANEVAS